MKVVHTNNINKQVLIDLFIDSWGDDEMVVSSGTYQLSDLPGFVAYDETEIIGVITYIIRNDQIEIISLDSFRENVGIGSQLLKKLEEISEEKEITNISVITTNDNLNALKFYQKRGYSIAKVIPNAVEKARKQKPSIPQFAENGIPIRDEIVLEKYL
ncbi:GNAT family N-acetyltransferase [Mammaliicoccus sciuri]|uniref:GNAT family N-acetyltransferase n=1 Tax=Mammaliicoccus sciuri TaxID=1296 RepID=UPI00066A4F46|nr:GNAT family N-acetyltransferase [Mammaliicoccus sciuri]MCD3219670.1 GNAT family N-acetyltransferase [Mammaliicoccus sciuri]MCJ0909712.1 GNAT family N-acetyltransferase [Mammaliicoccus sciuri]MCJ0925146.1 GNAT family N-acetyltransferase [Mammaliicoccus sciuri]MCJ1761476.1 GNAT family N-acetyltransferase [Mammaliicoccus sciuri]MDO0950907.1 GNAT family N-acetyltransferase [Mammaliicoccus sciuri]